MKNLQKDLEAAGEQMTLFSQAASRNLANLTAPQEKDWGKKTSAISGRRCLDQYERFNHATSWAKMFPALLIGMGEWSSRRCRLSWKLKATRSHRLFFQLVPSTLPIEEIEFGLLPTPTTQEPTSPCEITENGRRKTADGQDSHSLNLGRMAGMGLLPTPNAMDTMQTKSLRKDNNMMEGGKHGVSLHHLASHGMLPTPAMSNYKGASSIEALEARGRLKSKADNLADQFAQHGISSQLNPRFVLEMMGFPPDWTELPFLNGETNQSKQEETQ